MGRSGLECGARIADSRTIDRSGQLGIALKDVLL
jgi:hypothetical protein